MLVLVLVLLLTSCAGTSKFKSELWPRHIPSLEYYQNLYAEDSANSAVQSENDYLRWVKRFYLGWVLYPNGWDWLTDNALSEASSEQDRMLLKVRLAEIGEKVSGEWAKDSAYRTVNSAHLMTWGNVLKLSLKRQEIDRVTAMINSDVDELLGRKLIPSDIDFDRYFPPAGPTVAHDDTELDPFDV